MNTRRTFIGSLLAVLGLGGGVTAAEPTVKYVGELKPCKIARRPILRLWKLGSLDHKLYPTQETIDRLAELLMSINTNEDVDLIWGPDLTVEEHILSEGDLNVVANSPHVRIIKPDENGRIVIKKETESGNPQSN